MRMGHTQMRRRMAARKVANTVPTDVPDKATEQSEQHGHAQAAGQTDQEQRVHLNPPTPTTAQTGRVPPDRDRAAWYGRTRCERATHCVEVMAVGERARPRARVAPAQPARATEIAAPACSSITARCSAR